MKKLFKKHLIQNLRLLTKKNKYLYQGFQNSFSPTKLSGKTSLSDIAHLLCNYQCTFLPTCLLPPDSQTRPLQETLIFRNPTRFTNLIDVPVPGVGQPSRRVHLPGQHLVYGAPGGLTREEALEHRRDPVVCEGGLYQQGSGVEEEENDPRVLRSCLG